MAYHVDDPTLETPRNYTTTRDVTIKSGLMKIEYFAITTPIY
jgi:hypothetical protein